MRVGLVSTFWVCCAFIAPSTYGAVNAVIGVTATVVNGCEFRATNDLSFGVIQQGLGVSAIASDPVVATIHCNYGTHYTISDNGGVSGEYFLSGANGQKIPYSITYNSSGSGTGKDTNFGVSATIVPADYDNAEPGSYSDTLIFTLEY